MEARVASALFAAGRIEMRTVVRVLFVLFLASAALPADATVCRLPGLNGYEAEAARANVLLPPPTRDPRELAIYIERGADGSFYYHSNFKSVGADEATKIGHEPTLTDVEFAVQNIVWTESPSEVQRRSVATAYFDNARIYVNRDVFREDGSTELQLAQNAT
jgi:hypothetical protein